MTNDILTTVTISITLPSRCQQYFRIASGHIKTGNLNAFPAIAVRLLRIVFALAALRSAVRWVVLTGAMV